MLDIDHFKQVNDTYGHDAGDKALRALSSMLISEFRTIDLVGRLGGEEFALVFPETDLAGARIACERLRTTTQATKISVGETEISLTVSIGLATATTGMIEGSALLKRADELLYAAKNGGRNRLVISTEVPPASASLPDAPNRPACQDSTSSCI
jgi:diguanylate cyclase (GGDEF)-like protein